MQNLKDKYFMYLAKKKGYSENTARSYKSFVNRIAERENLNDLQFAESIDELIKKYDAGGVEEEYGNRGRRTAINSLCRFKEFVDEEHISTKIEKETEQFFVDNNIVYQKENKRAAQSPESAYEQKRKQMMEKRSYFASISAHYWAYVTLCFSSFFAVFSIAENIPDLLKNALSVVILILGIIFALVWILLNSSYDRNMKQLSLELQLLELKLNSTQKNLEKPEALAQKLTLIGAYAFLSLFIILLVYMIISLVIHI